MSAGKEVWVHCADCSHSWIAAHLPMEAGKLARVTRRLLCPKCAAPSKRIYLGKAPPDAREAGR